VRALGGFDAIRATLTDDYAMALLYLDSGYRLVQSTVVHPVRTTVADAGHYGSILRRWMIFAMRYLRENQSPFTLGLIGLPTLAPFLLLLIGLALGPRAVAQVLALVLLKASAMYLLRAWLLRLPENPSQIAFEALADLLLPLHLATALVRPARFRWRSRHIRMQGETITYE
jgi:hypothetical protein